MELTDIQALISEKIQIFKDYQGKKELPEYNPVFREAVEYYEKISIHTEQDVFPEKLFKKRAPNQTDEEFEYIKENFKSVTYPVFSKYLGFLNRIWNDANWSIQYGEDETRFSNNTAQEYLEKGYPVYGSLENYFKDIVTKWKEKDPNAVICHKPYDIPTIEKDGEILINDTELIKPIAKIYPSKQVIDFKEGLFCLVELTEKSWVEYGPKKVKEGKIFELYTTEHVWRIVQVGKKIDYNFEYILYWSHNLGYVPASKLRAEPIEREEGILYKSHFMPAVPALDLMLLDNGNLQISKNAHVFPQKWEIAAECDYENEYGHCVAGKIPHEGKNIYCPSCNGTGTKRISSPLGVYQIKEPTATEGSGIPTPPFGYVSPDPAVLEFLRSEIDANEDKALSILNLHVGNSQVKGSDVALTRQIDREEAFSMLLGISNQVFQLFEFSHKCILEMRYGPEVELPVISYPRNFAIKNEQELTAEIAEAKEKGLPDLVIRNLILEYLKVRFNYQEEVSQIVDLAFNVDRIITLSTMDIQQKKLSGSVANWEDILHTSIWVFIEEVVQEDENFFELELSEQKRILIEKAKAKDTEVSPQRMNPDTILANLGA